MHISEISCREMLFICINISMCELRRDTYSHMYIYISMYIHMHLHMCAYICKHIAMRICVFRYFCVELYVYLRVHVRYVELYYAYV